jgi:hypothetical protein
MSAKARHLTLLVTGLLRPPVPVDPGELLGPRSLQGLERLLSRADPAPSVAGDGPWEGLVLALFGLMPSAAEDPPVAPVTRYLDTGERDAAWYLRADPVHLRADINKVLLFDADAFQLSPEEALALAAEVRPTLASLDGELIVGDPRRWYLRLSHPVAVRTRCLSEAVGRDLQPLLPEGERRSEWRRLLNELQMVLHASPVNQAREARGDPAINSLWLWGGGRLPAIPERRWDRVCSDDALALGMARLTGSQVVGKPAAVSEWLREGSPPGEDLVVLDALERPARYADMDAWMEALVRTEQVWFLPLLRALRGRELASLTLVCDGGVALRATPGSVRRWWRPTRRLATFLRGD